MQKNKDYAIVRLLIMSFLITGCNSASPNVSDAYQEVLKTPTTSFLSEEVLPGNSYSADEGTTPSILSDLELKRITRHNIRQITPIAVLDDIGFYSAILSADGKRMAVSNSRTIEVFETSSKKRVAVFEVNSSAYLAFSLDETRLAAWYIRPWSEEDIILKGDKSSTSDPRTEEKTVVVWDLSNQEAVFSKNADEICGSFLGNQLFQFQADGTLVLANVDFETHTQRICQVSAEDGSLITQMDFDSKWGYLHRLAITSDGQIVVAVFSSDAYGYANPTLVIYQYPNAKILFEKKLTEMPELAFIPESHVFAMSATDAHKIDLLNTDGILIRSFSLPPEVTKSSSLSANRHYLMVESELDDVIIYDLESGAETRRISLVFSKVPVFDGKQEINYKNINVSLDSEDDYLLVTQRYQGEFGDSLKRVFDLGQPEKEAITFETAPGISHLSDLSADGNLIAMGGLWNGDVRIWSTTNGKIVRVLHVHTDVVNQSVFSPDGTKLAMVSADSTVKLWSVGNGELLATFTGHQGWVLRVAFSPDGSKILTSGFDNTLRLWDVASGVETNRFQNPISEGVVKNIWFTADHFALVNTTPFPAIDCLGCRAQSYLLDTNTGSLTLAPWEWLNAYTSPEGDWLLNFGVYPDYRLSVGKMQNGQFTSDLELVLSSINNSGKIALSPEGEWIYTSNFNGINIFDRKSGEQVDLAANYLCSICTSQGNMQVDPDGYFLVDNAPDSLILWGVTE